MNIYFTRHGESVANSSDTISSLDTPLTKRGISQAIAVGKKLADKDISKIICSPLPRTRQTAILIADSLKIPIIDITIIDELQERHFGELTNQPKRHETEFYFNNDSDHNIEPRQELINRMSVALEKIKQMKQKTNGNIVIVGHQISGFYLFQIAKGNIKFDNFEPIKRINNCALIELKL